MGRSWAFRGLLEGVLLLAVAAGCDRSASRTAPQAGDRQRPVVRVVNYPLEYFAQRIGAGYLDVELPVPAGEDPAYWKPSAEEIGRYQQADLILLNGAGYARWVSMASLPQARLVDTSAGFKERLIHREQGPTHTHGPGGKHAHGGTAFTTWLDPTLAIAQARAILAAFGKRWPEHATAFAEGFAELEKDLTELDATLERALVGATMPLLFSHPVYAYFERRYGLDGKSVHWEPGEMPGEAQWTELEAILRTHPARWMIWEAEPSAAVVARLKGLGVDSVVFDPCANAPARGDFLSVMRENARRLAAALAGG